MLLDIGAIVGFYALARLAPSGWAGRVASVLASIVIVVSLADLGSNAIRSRSIVSRAPVADSGARPASAAASATSASTPAVRVTRAGGGSIRTLLGYGIVVAKDSTMSREWIAVHDPVL